MRKIILTFIIIAVAGSVFTGCRPRRYEPSPQLQDVPTTAMEIKKAQLQREIDRKYDNPHPHYELGRLYLSESLYDQAENQFNIALSFDPAHRMSQAALVKTLMQKGQTEKAKMAAEMYVNQVSGSAGESLRLAMGFQKEQLDEYAMPCYRRAMSLAPNSSRILRQIGFYYLSKGDKLQAKEYLSRSFQLNPDQPDVARELGRLGIAVKIPRTSQTAPRRPAPATDQNASP